MHPRPPTRLKTRNDRMGTLWRSLLLNWVARCKYNIDSILRVRQELCSLFGVFCIIDWCAELLVFSEIEYSNKSDVQMQVTDNWSRWSKLSCDPTFYADINILRDLIMNYRAGKCNRLSCDTVRWNFVWSFQLPIQQLLHWRAPGRWYSCSQDPFVRNVHFDNFPTFLQESSLSQSFTTFFPQSSLLHCLKSWNPKTLQDNAFVWTFLISLTELSSKGSLFGPLCCSSGRPVSCCFWVPSFGVIGNHQPKAQFTQDAEHLATDVCKFWNTLQSMGVVFTQVASNIKGFAHKFACKCAYVSCVNRALVLRHLIAEINAVTLWNLICYYFPEDQIYSFC